MGEYTMRLNMQGNDQGASVTLDRVSGSAQKLNQNLKDVSLTNQRMGADFGRGMLGGLGIPLGAAAVGSEIVSIVRESIVEYAKAQRVQLLLDNALKQTGEDQEGLTNAIQKTSDKYVEMGIASREEVNRIATTLVTLGIKSEDIGRTMELAFRVAAVKGVDADTVIRRIAFSLTSTKDPAEKLHMLMKGLDDFGGGILPSIESLSTGFGKVKTQAVELKETIGELFTGKGSGAGGWLAAGEENLKSWIALLNQARDKLTNVYAWSDPSTGKEGTAGSTARKEPVLKTAAQLRAEADAIRQSRDALTAQLLEKGWGTDTDKSTTGQEKQAARQALRFASEQAKHERAIVQSKYNQQIIDFNEYSKRILDASKKEADARIKYVETVAEAENKAASEAYENINKIAKKQTERILAAKVEEQAKAKEEGVNAVAKAAEAAAKQQEVSNIAKQELKIAKIEEENKLLEQRSHLEEMSLRLNKDYERASKHAAEEAARAFEKMFKSKHEHEERIAKVAKDHHALQVERYERTVVTAGRHRDRDMDNTHKDLQGHVFHINNLQVHANDAKGLTRSIIKGVQVKQPSASQGSQ